MGHANVDVTRQGGRQLDARSIAQGSVFAVQGDARSIERAGALVEGS